MGALTYAVIQYTDAEGCLLSLPAIVTSIRDDDDAGLDIKDGILTLNVSIKKDKSRANASTAGRWKDKRKAVLQAPLKLHLRTR